MLEESGENGLVLELLSGLRCAGLSVTAVMESSGTYGDVLRHQLLEHGVPVYRVSGKRTQDAAEVAISSTTTVRIRLVEDVHPWIHTGPALLDT